MHDIVYIVKNGIDPYELTYSLRSLKHFPHGNVWIYGGEPEGIKADRQVAFRQKGINKWEKVKNSLQMVCENDEITEDFWLFNDDFFCMRNCLDLAPIYHGTIHDRVQELKKRHRTSEYMMKLLQTEAMLRKHGCDTLNYAVHMPMLVNREKAIEVLDVFGRQPMFRCLYGNYVGIGGEDREDVKIYKTDEEPDHEAEWLSTTNETFAKGLVGEYIRSRLKEASKYEIR